MRYSKPAKTFEEQADLFLERGLVADRDQLIRRLRVTSYFRLTTYLYRFRVAGSEKYQPGTTLERVWKLYNFEQAEEDCGRVYTVRNRRQRSGHTFGIRFREALRRQ